MLGLAGDDELEDEGEAEQRNRYCPCHHQFCYQRFLDIFFRLRHVVGTQAVYCWYYHVPDFHIHNCPQRYWCEIVKMSSMFSMFPASSRDHFTHFQGQDTVTGYNYLQYFYSRAKKNKQIVPISIFLKISFISQHPTQGGVGQLASWKGERDWGWYPASEKWLFAFLARIFFLWEK